MVQYNQLKNESGVYCFKNLVNGKCYIGHAKNLKKKLRAHYATIKAKSNLQYIFYKDVLDYGIENFDLDILEFTECSITYLHYIEVLKGIDITSIDNSYVKEGENIETEILIWTREIGRSEYSYGLTVSEASKKSNIDEGIIKKILNHKYTKPYFNGWTFAFDEITLFQNCAAAYRDMAKGKYELNITFKKGQRTSNRQ